jgi:hypothetical protein
MTQNLDDLVVYHNPDRTVHDIDDAEHFRVETNNEIAPNSIFRRVWVIGSSGQPRQYCLSEWFAVVQCEPSKVKGFKYSISGTGDVLDPPRPLNDLPWFAQLLESQADFSLGLNAISPEFVPYFEELL